MKKSLDDIEKSNPFAVPDRYFENLTSRIQTRIAVPERTFQPELRFILKWAIAPVVLAAFFIAYQIADPKPVDSSFLSEVSNEDIINYLEQSGIGEDELVMLLDPETDISMGLDQLDHLDLDGPGMDELINEYDLNSDYL